MAAPAETPSDDQWHVKVGGEVKVLTLDQLDDLFRLEIIDSSTKVWQPGMPEWLPLSVVAGMDDSEPAAPAPPPVVAPSAIVAPSPMPAPAAPSPPVLSPPTATSSAAQAEPSPGAPALPPPPSARPIAVPKSSSLTSTQRFGAPPPASMKTTLPFGPAPLGGGAPSPPRPSSVPPSARASNPPVPPSGRSPVSVRSAAPRPEGFGTGTLSLPSSLPPPPPPIQAPPVAAPAPAPVPTPPPSLASSSLEGAGHEAPPLLPESSAFGSPAALDPRPLPHAPSAPAEEGSRFASAAVEVPSVASEPRLQRLGKLERTALIALGVVGAILILYRNDVLGGLARSAGAESAYRGLSSALGGPSRETPAGVRAFTASLPPLAPPEALKPKPVPPRPRPVERATTPDGAASQAPAPGAKTKESQKSKKAKSSKSKPAKPR